MTTENALVTIVTISVSASAAAEKEVFICEGLAAAAASMKTAISHGSMLTIHFSFPPACHRLLSLFRFILHRGTQYPAPSVSEELERRLSKSCLTEELIAEVEKRSGAIQYL